MNKTLLTILKIVALPIVSICLILKNLLFALVITNIVTIARIISFMIVFPNIMFTGLGIIAALKSGGIIPTIVSLFIKGIASPYDNIVLIEKLAKKTTNNSFSILNILSAIVYLVFALVTVTISAALMVICSIRSIYSGTKQALELLGFKKKPGIINNSTDYHLNMEKLFSSNLIRYCPGIRKPIAILYLMFKSRKDIEEIIKNKVANQKKNDNIGFILTAEAQIEEEVNELREKIKKEISDTMSQVQQGEQYTTLDNNQYDFVNRKNTKINQLRLLDKKICSSNNDLRTLLFAMTHTNLIDSRKAYPNVENLHQYNFLGLVHKYVSIDTFERSTSFTHNGSHISTYTSKAICLIKNIKKDLEDLQNEFWYIKMEDKLGIQVADTPENNLEQRKFRIEEAFAEKNCPLDMHTQMQ